ncbi:hypothetical protein [Rhizobium freirei]|uniref:hypothetical protein n=1 Tax=Rhizobium freirei TaxID=1353277 RepID=UPI0012F7214F|nr:hypothetical protein [Rhizobium freirei]
MRQSARHIGGKWICMALLPRTTSGCVFLRGQVSCHASEVDDSFVWKGGKGGFVRGRSSGGKGGLCRGMVIGCGLVFTLLSKSGLPRCCGDQSYRHPLGFVRSEPDGGSVQGRVPRRIAAGGRRPRKAARGLRRAFGPAFHADLPFSAGSLRTLIRSTSPVHFDRTRGDAGRAGRFRGFGKLNKDFTT